MARSKLRRILLFLALLLPLSACSFFSGEPEAPKEEAVDPLAQEAEEELPPEPPPPEPAPVEVEAHVDAGEASPASSTRLVGASEEEERAAPEAWFLVRSERALPQIRVRLFDEAGRVVPSEDQAEVGQGSRYRLRPVEPLVPGSLYRLVIDSQEGSKILDVDGSAYLPRTLSFRTLGEKPAPKPQPKRKRGR